MQKTKTNESFAEASYTDQLERLRGPRPTVTLVRPCTLGDGIEDALAGGGDKEERLLEAWAAARHRITSFIPASGAATRLWSGLDKAPPELVQRLAHAREAGLPKGLVPFHRYPDGSERTAVEEHVREALLLGGTQTRVHFTVGAEVRSEFERELARIGRTIAPRAHLELGLQDPATDTVAIDAQGQMVKTRGGEPLLRPGGHGALLPCLNALKADLVVIKNIDNICADPARPEVVTWRRRLVGLLLGVEQQIHALLRALDQGTATEREVETLLQRLSLQPPSGVDPRSFAREQLHRPLRVCGMVPAEGHAGGGPFWVRDPDGLLRRQIVEDAQIDRDDPEQVRIHQSSTHFSPTEIAGSVRDHRGKPYDLERYVDDRAWIVTEKQHEGRPIRVLERPGLWNGSMAGWVTLFVEMPSAVFQPVKSILDLLQPAHDGCSTRL